MKNIYLIGMRGSGKTTVGKILAKQTDCEFVDMDAEIIKTADKSVPEIVEEEGWDSFRKLEHQVLKNISEKDNQIIATGGGVPIYFNNSELMKDSGKIVLLKVDMKIIAKRIKKSEDRPSLTGDHFLDELAQIWSERKEKYLAAADLVVETDDIFPKEVVAQIIEQNK